jgi:hypothetical protein
VRGFGLPAFLFGPAFLKVPLAIGARLAGAFLANFFGPEAFLKAGRFPSDLSDLSGLSDLSERSTFSVSARQVDVAGRESDL